MFKKILGSIWQKMPRGLRLRIIRATQKKFTASAAAIIVNERQEILLLEHAIRAGDGWGIPGGFLESGEQAEDAVRRELLEEIALELENVRLFRVRIINRHIEFLFLAETHGVAEIKSGEIKSIGWFGADELPEQMSLAQKSIIRKVLSGEFDKKVFGN
jgi:mutator protein MutT